MNALITRVKAEIIAKAKAVSKAMSNDMMACVDACAACAASCEYCVSQCLASADVKALTDCIRCCTECATLCRTTASAMAQGSATMSDMCALCAKSAAACAAECAKHAAMDCCIECADECGDCVEQCTNMATMKAARAHLEKGASMKRAYSLFTVKSVNEEQRIIDGIATTPSTDRMGDVVDSEGAQFNLPLPLLWMHNSREPVGQVTAAKVSKAGISITAQLAKIAEPGTLKDRLDEAWQSLKIGLVRGLSIGFKPIESAQIGDTWAEHFLKWDWLELSCVTIPANADASILSVKSADQKLLAATRVVRLSDKLPGTVTVTKSVIPLSERKKGVVYL